MFCELQVLNDSEKSEKLNLYLQEKGMRKDKTKTGFLRVIEKLRYEPAPLI